jgi:hypothetical protein
VRLNQTNFRTGNYIAGSGLINLSPLIVDLEILGAIAVLNWKERDTEVKKKRVIKTR